MSRFNSVFFALLVLFPASALAILHCEGSLSKDDFAAERSAIQKELQSSILNYRKLESENPEANKAEMAKVMTAIEEQKNKFKMLDSKYFPKTPVTAYGSACSDRRWVEEAKAKLVEKPELLGKQWYVWLDKATRTPKAAPERPPFGQMAE